MFSFEIYGNRQDSPSNSVLKPLPIPKPFFRARLFATSMASIPRFVIQSDTFFSPNVLGLEAVSLKNVFQNR